MSSGIVEYVEARNNAIKAWTLEGYTPLDDLKEEYGLTCEYLFQAGLMVEKETVRISPPSYSYRLNAQGRLLMAEVEELSLILIRPECLAKLFLICMAETVCEQDQTEILKG